MKGFFRFLPPFSPDYSGAVSALFNAGGMVVLCDPGGCSGNVAGYDEPRFYGKSGVFFSAAIREMDTIFGRDDKLEEKIIKAATGEDFKFIALVSSPVVCIIGTDLNAVAKKVEAKTGIPSFAVMTTGMEDYSFGEALAELALVKKFCCGEIGRGDGGTLSKKCAKSAPCYENEKRAVLGAVPLNAVGNDDLVKILDDGKTVFLSEENAVETLKNMDFGSVLCVSPAGLKAARFLNEKFDIPYEVAYPESPELKKAADQVESALSKKFATASANSNPEILIVHQTAAAETLSKMLLKKNPVSKIAKITIGNFFKESELATPMGNSPAATENSPATLHFSGEDDFSDACKNFDIIIADPMYKRAALSKCDKDKTWISLPHIALSGDLYL